MTIVLSGFGLAKAGNRAEEYEDAVYIGLRKCYRFLGLTKRLATIPPELTLRMAVADGATETSFAGFWANLLVRNYCEQSPIDDDGFAELITSCRAEWLQTVSEMNLPWYAEEKRAMGAFSALIGLKIVCDVDNQSGHWNCLAIGDSCLFHFRKGALLEAFPIADWKTFSATPCLISSVDRAGQEVPAPSYVSGSWQVGDQLILMSDALACWLLRAHSAGEDPLQTLDGVDTAAAFQTFVSAQRGESHADGYPHLRNDDVTLLRCCFIE